MTITNLGTSNNKAGANLTLSVSASAGNWLIVSVSGDTLPQYVYCPDGRFFGPISVDNSGNVAAVLFFRKLYGALSSQNITVVVGASSAANEMTAYSTDLNLSGSANAPDSTGSTSLGNIYSLIPRVGNGFWAAPGTITSVDVYLEKFGSPTGTAYVRIRDAETDSIIGTLGSIDVSTITAGYHTFNSGSAVISSNQYVRLTVEYDGGDITNCIRVNYSAEGIAVPYTYYTYAGSSWSVVSQNSMRIQNFTGAKYVYPIDKSDTATGSGATAGTSTGTGTLTQADELGVGIIAMEEQTDEIGTWTNDTSHIYDATYTQQDGTTGGGGASNTSIFTTLEVLSATTAQNVQQTSTGTNDWAAIVATLLIESAVTSTGTLSQTLGALTLSATASVADTINGALEKTLGALTLSAVGKVYISAALSKTLGALTASGVAEVDVSAALSKTLGELLTTATAEVDVSAVLSKTLDALTSSASADVLVNGQLSQTLGALTLSASATTASVITGALSKTLGELILSASARAEIEATLSRTLGALTANALGEVVASGTLDKTLGALTSDVLGAVTVEAALAQSLGALTSQATAQVLAQATLDKTLGELTLSGSATTQAFAVGTLSQTLGELLLSANAKAEIQGTLAKTLGELTLDAAGLAEVRGLLAQTLGTLMSDASAVVLVQGALDKTLGELTLSGTGTLASIVTGLLNQTLGELSLNAAGSALVEGQLDKTLGALTSTAAAGVAVNGTLDKTLGTLVLNGVADNQGRSGALSVVLGALLLVASGTVKDHERIPANLGYYKHIREEQKENLDRYMKDLNIGV